MNNYVKFMPNVFIAKCEAAHEKGDYITLTTRYGTEHECIVFNLIYERDGYYHYSVVRADGYNVQERAKAKADRLMGYAANAEKRGNDAYEASKEGADFLRLAEPIKVGHHSEKGHRALIERNHKRMGKFVDESKKADEYQQRAAYWESKANTINLSMPESLEYYEFELEKAMSVHAGIKSGAIPKRHSYSLTYAKKHVNEVQKKVDAAKILWGEK